MKKIFFLMALACLCLKGLSQTKTKLQDGLYLVAEIVKDSTRQRSKNKTVFVRFNPLFLENAPDSAQALLVYSNTFVPLELAQEPELLDQTDQKKKIQLSFSRLAADKLEKFTSENLMKQVTLIVDGQALTTHGIRAVISGGKMEITRCDDNACQKIYIQLKDNVKR
jgi:preprotein translocase subunit SecD